MKLLCVECDEAMRLEATNGPDRGSMTVLFACPACGRRTAMLTNSMETQVVRSLGVKIGGRTAPSEPMEMVRGSLLDPVDIGPSTDDPRPEHRRQESSKCPFTGMVNDAFARNESVQWTESARLRMEKIPEFARAMVMKGIEDSARRRGVIEISDEMLDEVRGEFGM